MAAQPQRCPRCLNTMPLARRRCPLCRRELPPVSEIILKEILILEDVLSGHIEFLSEIAHQNHTAVFLAHDLILNRKVVIKSIHPPAEIHPDLFDRWLENSRRAIQLDHPNIIHTYHTDSIGSTTYFINEFAPQDILSDILSAKRTLPIWKCLRISRDLAIGMHAVQNQGIVHYYLKPSNVTITVDGFAQLMDIGSSMATLNAFLADQELYQDDEAALTAPHYTPTNVLECHNGQFMIGLLLYRLLTGSDPFPDDLDSDTLNFIAKANQPSNPGSVQIPEELSLILHRMLSSDLDVQYPDMGELAVALESLDPELWKADLDPSFQNETQDTTIYTILTKALHAEKTRDYRRSVFLCEQALAISPYNERVINHLVRAKKQASSYDDIRSLLHKSISTFYNQQVDVALSYLERARYQEKDSPEISDLIEGVLYEQKRQVLIKNLFDSAQLYISTASFVQAISQINIIQELNPRDNKTKQLLFQMTNTLRETQQICSTLELVHHACRQHQFDNADRLLNKILLNDADNIEAKMLKKEIDEWHQKNRLMELMKSLNEQLHENRLSDAQQTLTELWKLKSILSISNQEKINRIRLALLNTIFNQ